MAKHMGFDERKCIEFLLGCGMKVAQIAVEVGRPDSTVVREIIARRIDSDKRLGCSNRLCARFDECMRKVFTGFGERLRKNQPRCFETCPDFFEAHCPRLAKSPYVCNGCGSERNCPMRKKYYLAPGAQANYEGTLVNSRLGVRVGEEAVAAMDAVLSPCIRRGQSVRNVVANNPGTFGDVKERTVYDWINGGLFHAKRHDQPFACSRGGRPKKAQETKTDAKCRVGRTIREMWEWLKEHAGVVACELDTVIGSISGKVLYTMIFPATGLALAFLRDRRTAQTTTRLFNMLWGAAGPALFVALFRAILTDNGPEFSDPYMIENWRPDPDHNPTRIEPRGVRVWFTDPYCATQKPHIERVHEEIRRVLVKGVSFNPLTQDGVNLIMSHVNSYTRPTLGNRCAYDLFVEKHGEEGKRFLDELGVRRIPNNEVTLHPFLLGQKFQKLADKAILRKAGIREEKGTPTGK